MNQRSPIGITKAVRLCLVVIATVGLVVLGWGRYRYGSFAAAQAVIAGRPIEIEEPAKTLGQVTVGETRLVDFVLKNPSGRPVRIVGSRMSCTCTTAESLPDQLSAERSQLIRINFKPTQAQPDRDMVETVRLFTDLPDQPELILTFTARVVVSGEPTRPAH